MKNINDYFVLYKWPNQLIFGYGESRACRQSLEPKTVYCGGPEFASCIYKKSGRLLCTVVSLFLHVLLEIHIYYQLLHW